MERKKRIIILGGLGFIGKNLYKRLVGENKYEITLLTNEIHDSDSQFIDDKTRKHIITGSILDKDFIERILTGYDVIYSLAGSSGAADSIKDPFHDLDTNLKGHLNVLEAARKNCPQALLIFPSSRLVYGKPETAIVSEHHPLRPESIYAIHKLTTEHYYLLYKRLFDLNCIIFRISNPYGPYQRFGSKNYGILNWFIHKALQKREIEIYGDGSQKRDFIYIDDLINLFFVAMDRKELFGNVYNVGSGTGISLKHAVDTMSKFIPDLRVKFRDWPEIDKKIETGDYVSDVSLLKHEIGWEPAVTFEEGIRATINFYGGK